MKNFRLLFIFFVFIIQCYCYSETTASKSIGLYFPKTEVQNPRGKESPAIPNWFYYWKNGSVCGITDMVEYENLADSYGYYQHGENHINIGNLAASKNSGPEAYSKDNGELITVTGQGEGPQCAAETIAHELLHKEIYETWDALIVEAESDGAFDGDDYDDPDNDGIPNIAEINGYMGIITEPYDADTYNMGGEDYSRYGDQEIRCRKKELNPGIIVNTAKDYSEK